MALQISLHHRTAYRYSKPVVLGPQTIQLRPAPTARAPILSYSLAVEPADHTLRWQLDPQANFAARVLFPAKTQEFAVDVRLVADMMPVNPFDFVVEPVAATWPFQYGPDLRRDLQPFLTSGPAGPKLRSFVAGFPKAARSTVDMLVEVNQWIHDTISYNTRMEHGTQSADDTLSCATGSCRDSSWLLVEVFRQLGLAARFVSGYLIQLANEAPDGPKRDFADLHAWCEVFLPGAGWIGLDPTSAMLTSEGHIPLVCTATPAQAAPITGTVELAEVEFTHTIMVERWNEPVIVSRPFSDELWQKVRATAHDVDRLLEEQNVRLTMGGEPTFVGIDDPESLQWSLQALGPLKRARGLALLRDLREQTAPGGLLHFGQGKWYPGEALPRWAFHCVSRKDGIPVWQNVELIAHESVRTSVTGLAEALGFLQALTRRLQVSAENILPAFNGPALDDTKQDAPAGYVLPLRRRQPGGGLAWSSQLWFERPERLLLMFGDSPVGYRLPVEAMPFVAPDKLEYGEGPETYLGEPRGQRIPLPGSPAQRPELFALEPQADPLPPLSADAKDTTELVRPSLCVEVRDGLLHVFLPYVPVLADYLDLISAVEDTCRYTGLRIWVEGYTPPSDPRVVLFSLTPDPGVLEVNLPAAATWDEIEGTAEVLHVQAERHRLTPSKYGYDGSHLSTGGGSHIVLGGTTMLDSPVLRRPDLLRSMVAFWQNHPSLSYLFSGTYVGPTSQYPRVDEARVDALYELELSFTQLPMEDCPPHILDGLFRNLLVDATGNTHRAEFCIDKMYPPEGQGLRLGLLELRAFEMAPHVRMGLLQVLLVRALVAVLWRTPFLGSLTRWGTALHDRFMLPHFVWQDFKEVTAFLHRSGIGVDRRWFAPQFEFRFPRIGAVAVDGVELELRQALEPWNVLAEETTSGGTGRSVDSSLERMQVKLSGTRTEGRYVATCNGRRIPLHATAVVGESVAGIRYRARRLSAALHPTVPVHTPLTVDLIDTWAHRTVARCTYYAGPPDGSVHITRPTSAAEARERRLERFVQQTPLPGETPTPPEERNPVFPNTLDLRWPEPTKASAGMQEGA